MTDNTLAPLAEEWTFHLRAEHRSPRTIRSYRDAVALLDDFCTNHDIDDVAAIDRKVVEKWVLWMGELGHADASIQLRFAAAKSFFRWLVDEEIVTANPFDKLRQPQGEDRPPAVPSDDDLRRLLASIRGKDFTSRRDLALIRLLLDSAARVSEIVGLQLDDLNLSEGVATVRGKGNRIRQVPFGDKTAAALAAYLRERNKLPNASRPKLWLSTRGPLSYSAAYRICVKRGEAVGIKFHPHMSRHWAAHNWIAQGNSEGDLMYIGGWKSATVMQRYGRSVRAERAREAHRRAAPGDRL
jgi:site-specific recombinase XerD